MKWVFRFLILLLPVASLCQPANTDSIKQQEKETIDNLLAELKTPMSDSNRYFLIGRIVNYYNIKNLIQHYCTASNNWKLPKRIINNLL
jgi:hypothetical protein